MPSPPSSSTAPITTPDKVLAILPSATHPPKTTPQVLAETESQWIFTEAELNRSPSIRAGMDPLQERQLRAKGLSFISQAGIMLRLPQIALHTASLFFNRFLMRYSLIQDKRLPKSMDRPRPLHIYQIAALALHLSTKVSETPRKLKDLIVAFVRVALRDSNLIVQEDTKDYWRWRDTLLLNEDLMLETLCFDLHVESPHRLLFDLLKSLGAEHNKRLRNAAWAFVNDAGATTLGLRFHSKTIAASAIYAAAKHSEYLGDTEGVRFKDDARTGKPWWSAHGIELRDIRRCCNVMADMYEAEPVRAGDTPGREQIIGELDGKDEAHEDSMYRRLRTPSQGPEDQAPTRAKRRVDGNTKPEDESTPKPVVNGTSQSAPETQLQASQDSLLGHGDPATTASAGQDGREAKRHRTAEPSSGPGDALQSGDPSASTSKGQLKDEQASEEGELDE